ncbi:ABC transporter ATP-binding protein [Mycoplasmopsis canis PG 14]|uniref:Cobalt transporter ATP-binding subunit n=1 Tax=Mycoplasmopsis canis TaxID=29555 RepID=A0A449AQC5_9BACT|nr:cysteine peptidase family C39 domain-containing protein [Mycoplasmopsis canis]AMD81269.1 ABC transporter ATP-binding protein [Mycoplasmopsis canis PG 14]EIE40590.1 ABC transporter ATP-binding protein [Mycoplasmopsis canis PG 14]VEU68759.1 cobalt transporter ATP-binding subunit [Mycoplasmopsis canis]
MENKYQIQLSPWDCSLYVFNKYLSIKKYDEIPIEELKFKSIYNEKGIELKNFESLINYYGFKINVYSVKIEELHSIDGNEFPFASIIKINDTDKHMVLVLKIDKKTLWYYDPNYGTVIKKDVEEFKKVYENVCIEFIKENFYNEKEKNLVFQKKTFSLNNIFKIDKYKIICFTILLFELLFLISIPFINKRIINIIILYKLKNELILISSILITSILFIYLIQKVAFKISKKFYLKETSNEIFKILQSFQNSNTLLILNMPNIEIKNRLANLFEVIYISQTFLPNLLINLISFCISFLVLKAINTQLLILLFVIICIILIINYLKKIIIDKNYLKLINDSYLLDKNMETYINSLKEFHNTFLVNNILNKWNIKKDNFEKTLNNYENNINQIDYLENLFEIYTPLLVSVVGVIEVWNQRLEISNFVYFLTSINLFIKPIKGLFSNFNNYLTFNKKAKTLDIFEMFDKSNQEYPNFKNERIDSIQLSYAEFGYSLNKVPLINVDRLVFKDKNIIKGANGTGKSTLAKILSGSIKLNKGEIFVNEKISNLFYNLPLKEKIYYVNSDLSSLQISIKEFLGVLDEDMFFDLLKRKNLLNLNTLMNLPKENFLDLDFSSLSKGQTSYIKTLKIFLADYDVVIFDETFENIDENIFNEYSKVLQSELSNKLVIEISHSKKFIFEEIAKAITLNHENIEK